MPDGFISPHGGHRKLAAYQVAEIAYDATVKFCDRFISPRSRTHDQMVQAARSGKQNIIEGSRVSGTSKEAEIKLIGVARGSLEELLADYEDYLRVRGLKRWEKESREALFVRRLSRSPGRSYENYREYVQTRSDEVAANIIICLVNQANYLLDRLLKKLEQDFLKEGGLRERMTKARLSVRGRQ